MFAVLRSSLIRRPNFFSLILELIVFVRDRLIIEEASVS